MKQLTSMIMAILATAAIAQDDLDALLADMKNESRSAERASGNTGTKAAIEIGDANDKGKAAKVRRENLDNEYECAERMEHSMAHLEGVIAEEMLTDAEISQLSESARKYYESEVIARRTNELAKIQLECNKVLNSWTEDERAEFVTWKQKQAEERAARERQRKMQMEQDRKREQARYKAREEVDAVRRKRYAKKRRRIGNWRDDEWFRSGGSTDPENCCHAIEACNEELERESKHLVVLERLTQEKLAKLSPMAQQKYREKLTECKSKIEDATIRKKEYEEVRRENNWPTFDEVKKQESEKDKAKDRRRRREQLAEEELRMALRIASEEAKNFEDDGRNNCDWCF